MRLIYSEMPALYDSYTFPHAIYAQAENDGEIESIYQQGFLPYSADTTIETPTFYLARSLRIDIARFEDTSENRRVDKLSADRAFNILLQPALEFDYEDKNVRDLCQTYIDQRFSKGAMPPDRMDYVLHHPLSNHLLTYRALSDGDLKATIICSIHGKSIHYWFAFFELSMLDLFPFGKWVMWKTIHWAKENNYDYIYLGTCYGTKSLYKVRDFKGTQFFDGEKWNPDIKELKRRVKEDDEAYTLDRWKRECLFKGNK